MRHRHRLMLHGANRRGAEVDDEAEGHDKREQLPEHSLMVPPPRSRVN